MWVGRITASKFKSACCTDPAAPSKSIIMSVCYPELFQFSTAATKWGCQHEQLALEIYSETHKRDHQGLKLFTCGLFICADYPFLGASPDGLVECKCCGQGTCEVKVRLILNCACIIKSCIHFCDSFIVPLLSSTRQD